MSGCAVGAVFFKISSVFWLFLSRSAVERVCLEVCLRLAGSCSVGRGPWRWVLSRVFLRCFHFTKELMNGLFSSFSNLGPGVVQLGCRGANRLKFSFLRFKTLKIGRFCTLNETCLTPSAL